MAESSRYDSGIGVRVLLARRAAGLSQKQLAQKSGISQPRISEIEAGQNTSYERLQAIARATKHSIKYLIHGPESDMPDESKKTSELALSTIPTREWNRLAHLPKEEQERIFRHLSVLIREAPSPKKKR